MPFAYIKAICATLFLPMHQSAEKYESIEVLQIGDYKTVFLILDKIFWTHDPVSLGVLFPQSTSPLGIHLFTYNLWVRDGIPCLEVILAAESAAWAKHTK